MRERLIFIVQSWGDPHEMNRLIHYTSIFDNIDIYAFTRNTIHFDFGLRNVNNLGILTNRHYLDRIFIYVRTILLFCKLNRRGNTFYIQGTDNLFLYNIACLITFRKAKFVYQISDIIPILTKNNLYLRIFRYLDAKFVKKAKLLVVTSEAFVEKFYRKRLVNFDFNYQLIENKIHIYNKPDIVFPLKRVKRCEKKEGSITIGYFGYIRCKKSLQVLFGLAQSQSNFEIVIRGILSDSLKKYVFEFLKYPNIQYLGEYLSPFHLKEIYAEIDLAWICYPIDNHPESNNNWARSNRFYEAGYSKIPMITQTGTLDSFSANKYGVGINLNLSKIENCIEEITKLNLSKIKEMKENFNKIDDNCFVITDDYDNTNIFLNKIIA